MISHSIYSITVLHKRIHFIATMSKLVVVFGATGQQGSEVVYELLKDKPWKVRAVTRNTESDKSKAFEKLGAEVVAADFNNPETLTAAFKVCFSFP